MTNPLLHILANSCYIFFHVCVVEHGRTHMFWSHRPIDDSGMLLSLCWLLLHSWKVGEFTVFGEVESNHHVALR